MNILFVDDQPSVLASILSGTDWRALGFSNVYTAVNVSAAKEIFHRQSIDILVTDIEMPGEDGLSLVSWIRTNHYHTECIVLTSHADFFYAKSAIDLGIIDYVVQPARSEDITRAVLRARTKIETESARAESLKISTLTQDAQNDALREFFESWPDRRSIEEQPSLQKERLQMLEDFLPEHPDDQLFPFFLVQIQKWNRIPPAGNKLLQSYSASLGKVFPDGRGRMLSWVSGSKSIYSILFLAPQEDMSGFLQRLHDDLFQTVGCETSTIYLHSSLSDLHNSFVTLSNAEKLAPGSARIREAEPIANTDTQSRNYQMYFQQIRTFINSHMDEPVTRSMLSESLHLSPDYVSMIIRICSGMSTKEYITQRKMQFARTLVLDSFDSIGDIAQRCGYDSFAYFSKVYKETYGMTPSEDRKHIGN